MNLIRYQLNAFHAIKAQVENAKRRQFPTGTEVEIEDPHYKGPGVVVQNQEAPDELAVQLKNGTIWHYPLKNCIVSEK